MKALFILPAIVLGLAACAQNPPSSPMANVPPPAVGATTSSFSAQPPDNPTGSQGYQSPDTPRRLRPVGGI